MIELFESIPDSVWWTIGVVSVITFFVSLVALRIAVVRMADDYFMPDRDPDKSLAERHPVARWLGVIAKNVIGFILFVAGLIMLAMPGQGLLTMLMGIVLMDFPGKRQLEIFLIRRPSIHKAINWMRNRAGRPPIKIPEETDQA